MGRKALAEPGASDQTGLSIDRNTLARLRTLAGGISTASYLRNLTLELAKDVPPSLDDLAGGYSLTPIKRQLVEIDKKLTWLVDMVEEMDMLQQAQDNALLLLVPGYGREVRKNLKSLKEDQKRNKKIAVAHSASPEFQAWVTRVKAGGKAPVFPGFEWDGKGEIVYNPDGTPKLGTVKDPIKILGRKRKEPR